MVYEKALTPETSLNQLGCTEVFRGAIELFFEQPVEIRDVLEASVQGNLRDEMVSVA